MIEREVARGQRALPEPGPSRGVSAATQPVRLVAWIGFVTLFAVLAYGSSFATDAAEPDEPLYESSFFVASVAGLTLMIGVALLVSAGATRELLALRRPRSWPAALGLSLLVLVAIFAVGAVVGLFLDPAGEQGLLPERWPPPDAAVFALNAAAVVAGAPLAEELLFRGAGYSLLERLGPATAIVLSSLAWAAAHGLVEAFPLIFALGIGLGILRRMTGSVLPAILLHAVFNALALAAAGVEAGS